MQIETGAIPGVLSVANLFAIFGIIFVVGRFAEKVTRIEIEVKDCAENKIETAVAMSKLDAYKEALDNSNRLLTKVIYGKHSED